MVPGIRTTFYDCCTAVWTYSSLTAAILCDCLGWGVPYYYANEVYYTQTADGYMVVNPPEGQVSQTPPPQPPPSPSAATSLPQQEQMFMYPRNGQNEKQQAADRYQCHSWAVNQTNYDPTQPPGGMPSIQKNADYRRAMAACLDAHGYTVK